MLKGKRKKNSLMFIIWNVPNIFGFEISLSFKVDFLMSCQGFTEETSYTVVQQTLKTKCFTVFALPLCALSFLVQFNFCFLKTDCDSQNGVYKPKIGHNPKYKKYSFSFWSNPSKSNYSFQHTSWRIRASFKTKNSAQSDTYKNKVHS